MLHSSLLGDTDSRANRASQVGSLPRQPVPVGKIATIHDSDFSLVTQGQERKTREFLMDGDTKLEGKLQIGSQAAVEYRSSDGKNVTIHVVATPAKAQSK